jgi:hypothetical protein
MALAAAGPVQAWYVDGHRQVAVEAVRLLPPEVPAFFREAAVSVGEAAVDPDVLKAPATPALRDRESPEHFLDWELLEGRTLPELRSQYGRLLAALQRDPAAVGTLPYAVVEAAERLTLAFAEHRRWPDNALLRARAVLEAGGLAHYAADTCQPLHTTIHHDGRARPDGSSPHTGVHARMDALLERAPFDRAAALAGLVVVAASDPREQVLQAFAGAHERVEEVYAREQDLDTPAPGRAWPEATLALAAERYRAAVGLVAALYLGAWERSASIELPAWLTRPER